MRQERSVAGKRRKKRQRTFATDLIERNVDPKRVQELLGHKTLAMTMTLYAKVRSGSKRQALARLSYARDAERAEAPEAAAEQGENIETEARGRA